MKRRRLGAIGGAVVVLVLAVSAGWRLGAGRAEGSPRPAEMTGDGAATPVSTIAVEPRLLAQSSAVTGTVRSVQRAELALKISGRVTAVLVQEGQRVRAGQVLASLEAADLAAGVSQANANLGAARAAAAQAQTALELQRAQSQVRVEQAAAALKVAKAHLSTVQEGNRSQEVAAADQAVVQAEAEANQARVNAARYQGLYEQGAVSAMEAETRATAYEVAKSRLEGLRQQAALSHEGSRRQEIEAAQAQVAQAEQELRLAKASVAENRMKADQARVAQAQVGQAQAQRQAARVQYGYARLVAPFDGVVTARFADPGDLAVPGQPLLVVEDGRYRLEAQVPEGAVGSLQPGESLGVLIDALQSWLAGRVTEIVPSADPGSHSTTVKVALPPARGLTSGQFGRLLLEGQERAAVTVPTSAVIERGQLSQVFVVQKGRAWLRLVTVGERQDGSVEVLSGLQAGERVVAAPDGSLHDGQRVQEVGR